MTRGCGGAGWPVTSRPIGDDALAAKEKPIEVALKAMDDGVKQIMTD